MSYKVFHEITINKKCFLRVKCIHHINAAIIANLLGHIIIKIIYFSFKNAIKIHILIEINFDYLLIVKYIPMLLLFTFICARHDNFAIEINSSILFANILNKYIYMPAELEMEFTNFKSSLLKSREFVNIFKKILEESNKQNERKTILIEQSAFDKNTYEDLLKEIKTSITFLVTERKEYFFTSEEIILLTSSTDNYFNIFRALANIQIRYYSYGALMLCMGLFLERMNNNFILLEDLNSLYIDYNEIRDSIFLKNIKEILINK
ncbi:hypothetical protein H311_02159 [Anncaliia algerae PRA109]|nr:hypothetical protein H311_02159 [Anncaliia algerae PRA109]